MKIQVFLGFLGSFLRGLSPWSHLCTAVEPSAVSACLGKTHASHEAAPEVGACEEEGSAQNERSHHHQEEQELVFRG